MARETITLYRQQYDDLRDEIVSLKAEIARLIEVDRDRITRLADYQVALDNARRDYNALVADNHSLDRES